MSAILIDCDIRHANGTAKGRVTARDGDTLLHEDRIDLTSAASRRRFGKAVAEKLQSPESAGEVESLLLAKLDDLRQGATAPADDVDLSSRQRFVDGLDQQEQALLRQVEAMAEQRRFFHWDLEFPEAFYEPRAGLYDIAGGSDAKTSQAIERKPDGQVGFDAVVGNPPYVRQEALKADKDYLKTAYAGTFDAANDLYVYFMEREVELLKSGSLMSMIVANKWLRAGYGRKLRSYLLRRTVPQSIVDFGHSPIFPDADTFPCVPVFAKRGQPMDDGQVPPDSETFAACPFPREDYRPDTAIGPYVVTRRKTVPTRFLRPDGWTLEDPRVQDLLEKIRNCGHHLSACVGFPPLRGLLTGFNEAFFISAATREHLTRQDPGCAELMRPLFRGRHVDRWRPQPTNEYLIAIASSANKTWPWTGQGAQAERIFHQAYPAVAKHLSGYRQRLLARQDQGHHWWELRSCDYFSAFDQPRIVYQVILYHSFFSLVNTPSVHNDKVFMLPTDDLALLGVLSSPLMWWFLTRTLPHMKDEALATQGFLMEEIPASTGTAVQADAIRQTVAPLTRLADALHEWQREFTAEACQLAGADEPDARVVTWLPQPPDVFAARLTKLAGRARPPEHLLTQAASLHRRARAHQIELLTQQLELERRLATLVEDAYGLTLKERQLLRATRSVRDPLDVLEAKIAGQPADAPAAEE